MLAGICLILLAIRAFCFVQAVVTGEGIEVARRGSFYYPLGTDLFRWDQIEQVTGLNFGLYGLVTRIWSGGRVVLTTFSDSGNYFELLSRISEYIDKSKMDKLTAQLVEPVRLEQQKVSFIWSRRILIGGLIAMTVFLVVARRF